jgi:hypothetical protein
LTADEIGAHRESAALRGKIGAAACHDIKSALNLHGRAHPSMEFGRPVLIRREGISDWADGLFRGTMPPPRDRAHHS